MRTSLLLLSVAFVTSAGAQVFTSGFENWTGMAPSDWMGVKTNIAADSVEQVTTNVHTGAFAVRLRNAPSATKRFTTQPLHVDDAVAYDVTYWVRGQGDIRAALFDGRAANSGYSPNTAYVTVNSSTWSQQTSTVICANTNDQAEFILYVRNTTGPDRLVVDDVNITTGIIVPPVQASIYEIQYTTALDGVSPFNGQVVLTGGVVTGVDTIGADGYFIQNGPGPWTGVYVFDGGTTVAIGDSVTMQATVSEFNNKTELSSVTGLVNHGGFPVPAPAVLTPSAAANEQWEGVLVKILDIGALDLPTANFWEWHASNWQGQVIVDDVMYLYVPVVGNYYTITGIMDQFQADYKLCPRQLSDVEVGNGITEFTGAQVSIFPNPADAQLILDLTGITGRVEVAITDAIGRVVFADVLSTPRSTIDMSAMPDGVYTLTLRNNDAVRSTHVVVRH